MSQTTRYPKRPLLHKLGTIDLGIVETTPFVFQGRLYRFEYFRAHTINPKNPDALSHFQIVDVQTGQIGAPFASDCHMGTAFPDGEYVYAFGVVGGWAGDTIRSFRSRDLAHWEQYGEFRLPGWQLYNLGVCQKDGGYTLLMEIGAPEEECGPHPFTFRFARSTDLKSWTLTPSECAFQRDRYAGGPAIYTLDGDPYYYVLYLEAYPDGKYANCIARSRDLVCWEYSPVNPMLMYDEYEDKQIANWFLTPDEQRVIEQALDVNNSDAELCEFNGRTILYYSWGNQLGCEFLASAVYEGSMAELLHGFFS